MTDDRYGSVLRDAMKKSMAEPAKRPGILFSRPRDEYKRRRVRRWFRNMWSDFKGILSDWKQ